jgi:glycosyltransferase involved in cell wall biosynthesis
LHVAEVLKGGMASYLDEVLSFQKASLGSNDRLAVIVPQSQIEDLTMASRVKTYPFQDTGRRLAHFFTLFKLVRQITEVEKPDVVHAHSSFAGAACRLAFLFQRKAPAIVYCSHGWAFDREGGKLKNKVLAAVECVLSWWTDKIICISEHDRQSGLRAGIADHRLLTVLNGIADIKVNAAAGPAVEWADPDKLRVLFVGRFDRQKGVDVFFQAMAQLQGQCTAYAIGDASLGDAAVGAPPPNVRLTGWLPRANVQAYLQSCDVFVMPSRWEGFGLSALEAMRAGKLVVASGVGGLLELVEHGRSGFLVPPNQPDALVQTIRGISKPMAGQFGLVARERFLRMFTAQQMNQSILNVYADITGKPVEVVECS